MAKHDDPTGAPPEEKPQKKPEEKNPEKKSRRKPEAQARYEVHTFGTRKGVAWGNRGFRGVRCERPKQIVDGALVPPFGGVRFVDGIGWTDDDEAACHCRACGYDVIDHDD